MKGVFVNIAGPSAVGKSTIIAALLARIPGSARLVTTTSRPPRPGEVNGRDYFFVTRDEFLGMIARGAFLEYNEVHGNLYGSSREVLAGLLEGHRIVLANLDPEGVLKARQLLPPESVIIFVKPGSFEELERRIRKERHGDDAERRIETTRREMALAPQFEHVVTNAEGRLDDALYEITTILNPYLVEFYG